MKRKDPITIAMERALEEAQYYEPQSEEYTKIMENIDRLAEAKSKMEANKRALDPTVFVNAVTSFALVLLTMNYEKAACYTTKAVQWIRKLW